jgi:hypothetical protein
MMRFSMFFQLGNWIFLPVSSAYLLEFPFAPTILWQGINGVGPRAFPWSLGNGCQIFAQWQFLWTKQQLHPSET